MSQDTSNSIADMAKHSQVEDAFATPILRCNLRDVDELNAQLRTLILERERTTPSAAKSNQGGWQSAPDFFRWGESAVATLELCIGRALEIATARIAPKFRIEFEVYGWAAVNRKGHYNTTHLHPMATW